jgi:hypothetical protein
MMVIREHHLQYDADGAFPVVVEESDFEISEPDDSDVIEQRIQSIRMWKDAGRPARQTTTVVHKSSMSMTRLKRPALQIQPLVAKMTINDLEAIVMFDMGCYGHFLFSSPLSSYLLILSILNFQTISWTIINHSHQFHLICHMQIVIIHISFTFVSPLYHFHL